MKICIARGLPVDLDSAGNLATAGLRYDPGISDLFVVSLMC